LKHANSQQSSPFINQTLNQQEKSNLLVQRGH